MPYIDARLYIKPETYKKMLEGTSDLCSAVLRNSAGQITDHVPIVSKKLSEEIAKKAASTATKKSAARISLSGIKTWLSQFGKGQKALIVVALIAVAAGLGALGRWIYKKIKRSKGEKVNQEELTRLSREYDELRAQYNQYQFALLRYLAGAQKGEFDPEVVKALIDELEKMQVLLDSGKIEVVDAKEMNEVKKSIALYTQKIAESKGKQYDANSETVESQNDFCFIKKQLEMQIDLYEDE